MENIAGKYSYRNAGYRRVLYDSGRWDLANHINLNRRLYQMRTEKQSKGKLSIGTSISFIVCMHLKRAYQICKLLAHWAISVASHATQRQSNSKTLCNRLFMSNIESSRSALICSVIDSDWRMWSTAWLDCESFDFVRVTVA